MYQHTPVPRVLSSEASGRTKRRDDIVKRRASISGGDEGAQIQLLLEIRTLKRDERQKLLVEAGIKAEIDASQSLAIKADLAIPWYRLRVLRK